MNPNLNTVANPEPMPTRQSSASPQPTYDKHIRFYNKDMGNGQVLIEDIDNDYYILKVSESEYVGFDRYAKEKYHIYPDNTVSLNLDNGLLHFKHTPGYTINDMGKNQFLTDDNGTKYYIYNNRLQSKKETDSEGNSIVSYYNDDNSYRVEKSNDGVIYYDSNGQEYKHEYLDGKISYTLEPGKYFVIEKNGTYALYGDKTVNGNYTIDENGNIVYTDSDGNTIYRDQNAGRIVKSVIEDGVVQINDYETEKQTTIKNGKKTYAKINHIEYDEEAYDKILKTLNEIDGSVISNSHSDIQYQIDCLPDSSTFNIIHLNEHIKLIESLSKMTNYSLLAYQLCDQGLEYSLNRLIDSLFGDMDKSLANVFKKTINFSIEDNNDDGILEYKEDTDFSKLSKDAIFDTVFIDVNGIKWYINNNDTVVGVEGENIPFTFGGEKLFVSFDENGICKITDKNYNSLNIFGDYNTETTQYGGCQSVFISGLNPSILDNEYVMDKLNEYYPNATMEEKDYYLEQLAYTGCGNVAMANLVFKKFEGNEEGFYNTFGYPMYEMKFVNEGMTIDYNYEPVILELFHSVNGNSDIKKASKSAKGTSVDARNKMENYLLNNYGVKLDNMPDDCVFVAEQGYSLYNTDGSLSSSSGRAHAMIVVGTDENNQTIVSSWGEKYILEYSKGVFSQLYSKKYRKEYK